MEALEPRDCYPWRYRGPMGRRGGGGHAQGGASVAAAIGASRALAVDWADRNGGGFGLCGSNGFLCDFWK